MIKLNNILSGNSECHACKSSRKKLSEAYGENTIKGFIKKFEEEADDLGIETTEKELRGYIQAFDRLKAKLPNDQKDLGQWSLPKLIKFTTTGKSKEENEIEITPDVVYHNDDDSIVIYNGNSDKNCVTYGKGEKWCIASRSWAAHRYDESKGQPTFYLARNTNLPDSDNLSFIVIAVKNPARYGDKNYVLHPRSNNPHYPDPITYNELLDQAPWLKDVPNLKSIIKYQPLSAEEKVGQKYTDKPATYREWTKFPYKAKEQYLITRKNASVSNYRDNTRIFSDISDEEFVEKYLHKYPDVLEFVVRTADVINPTVLLKNLQNFSDSARKSITNNLHNPIKVDQLSSNFIPFDVKKLLVKLDKWKLDPNERIYVTKDGETIVLLKLGNDFKMGLYQEDDEFPNVKINKRTSKFLLDYPDLDKIPITNLIDLANKGGVDIEVIKRVIANAEEDPESNILVKKVGDEEVLIDTSLLTSYIIKGNSITKVPFEDERVQAVFNDAKDDTEFSKNVFKNAFSDPVQGIPDSVDFNALVSVINSLPYQDRTLQTAGGNTPEGGVAIAGTDYRGNPTIVFMSSDPTQGSDFIKPILAYTKGNNLRYGYERPSGLRALSLEQLEEYFQYLRDRGIVLNDDAIQGVLDTSSVYSREKRLFLEKNPPLDPNNILKPVIDPDDNSIYLIDTLNRRNSKKVSESSDRLINAPLSQQRFNQLLGTIQQPEQPAQEPTQATQQEPAQEPRQTPTGDISVAEVMRQLGAGNQFTRIPTSDFRRLNVSNARNVSMAASNGARKRNRMLGNAGQVEQVLAVPGPQGDSGIYVIRLRNGSRVISIRVQGPNNNYLLIPGETALALNSADQLMTALRQRNLVEIRSYLVKNYLDENPDQLEEVKQLLRKHINEKNEQEAA